VCNANGAYDPCICSTPNAGVPLEDAAADDAAPEAEAGTPVDSAGVPDSQEPETGPPDGGAWTPKALPGLAAWFSPDVGVVRDPQHGSALFRWLDQSGNDNTATAVTNQRYFEVDPQVLNGHDAYHCAANGSVLQIADAPSLQWGTGGFAIGAVLLAPTYTPSSFWQKDSQQGSGFSFGTGSDLDIGLWVAGARVITAIPNITKFHVVIVRASPVSVFLDQYAAVGPTTNADVSNAGALVSICAGADAQAEIAELVAVKGAVSDADVARLQTYFKTKFGL
jgi:hypothetical protein